MDPNSEPDYDELYKIVLVGDSTVGKTNLLSRYIKNTLPSVSTPTIGVEFAKHTISLRSGVRVRAQLWDTVGQEHFSNVSSMHYRRAVGALLVYDVTNAETFHHVQKWIHELKAKAEPDIIIMLVGNKVDLLEKNPEKREVRVEQAEDLARLEGLRFIETSAVKAVRVKDAFEKLVQEIYNNRMKRMGRMESGENLNPEVQRNWMCCG
jgi:small GTP-binding protein